MRSELLFFRHAENCRKCGKYPFVFCSEGYQLYAQSILDRAYGQLPEKDDALRGSGRTTAQIFFVLAEAALMPGGWVHFRDHAPMDELKARRLVWAIEDVIKRNQLHMEVERRGSNIFVKSTALDVIREARMAAEDDAKKKG